MLVVKDNLLAYLKKGVSCSLSASLQFSGKRISKPYMPHIGVRIPYKSEYYIFEVGGGDVVFSTDFPIENNSVYKQPVDYVPVLARNAIGVFDAVSEYLDLSDLYTFIRIASNQSSWQLSHADWGDNLMVVEEFNKFLAQFIVTAQAASLRITYNDKLFQDSSGYGFNLRMDSPYKKGESLHYNMGELVARSKGVVNIWQNDVVNFIKNEVKQLQSWVN
jgi:hypothetical protein